MRTLEEEFNEHIEEEKNVTGPIGRGSLGNKEDFIKSPYEYQLKIFDNKLFELLSEFELVKIDFEADDKSFERIKYLTKDIIPDIMKLREMCLERINKSKEDSGKGNVKKNPRNIKQAIIRAKK